MMMTGAVHSSRFHQSTSERNNRCASCSSAQFLCGNHSFHALQGGQVVTIWHPVLHKSRRYAHLAVNEVIKDLVPVPIL